MSDSTKDADNTGSQPSILGPEELNRAYDSLLGSLDSLRNHLGERRSAAALQELALRLGYFALALNHQMDGDVGKAESALAKADGRSARMPSFFSRPEALGGEDWHNIYH
jgi:hypothetical protein